MTQSPAPYDFTTLQDRRASQRTGRRAEDRELTELREQLRRQAQRIRATERRQKAVLLGVFAGAFSGLALYTFRLTFSL